jgi:hypothetical protein
MIPKRIARSLSGSFSLCDLQTHSIVDVEFRLNDDPPCVDANLAEMDLQLTTTLFMNDSS